MFVWIGCKLPESFEKSLRARCLAENREVGLDRKSMELPQHVSLKISFPTDRAEEVLAWLREYLSRQEAFRVILEQVEQIPGVLWLKVAENPVLENLHTQLDAQLEARFGVARHQLDRCFRFHSTLFMDADEKKLGEMAERLSDLPLPQTLAVDTFLLGICEDGDPDGYRIVGEVPAHGCGQSPSFGELGNDTMPL